MDIEADVFLWSLAHCEDPALVLGLIESHISDHGGADAYCQIWIEDVAYDSDYLLLLHEWGMNTNASVAPDFHRLRVGTGLVGEAFDLGRPTLRNMSDRAHFGVAAAPELIRAEGLKWFSVRPLQRGPRGVFLLARRDDVPPDETLMSAIEDLVSASILRFNELRQASFDRLVFPLVTSLEESDSEREILQAALREFHAQFEAGFSAVVRVPNEDARPQVVLSLPDPPSRSSLPKSDFLNCLLRSASPTRLFRYDDDENGPSASPFDGTGSDVAETMQNVDGRLPVDGHLLASRIAGAAATDLVVILYRYPLRPGFLPSDASGLSAATGALGSVIEHRRKLAVRTSILAHAKRVVAAPEFDAIVDSALRALEDLCQADIAVFAIRDASEEGVFRALTTRGRDVNLNWASEHFVRLITSPEPTFINDGASLLSADLDPTTFDGAAVLVPVVRHGDVVGVLVGLVERDGWLRRDLDPQSIVIFSDHLALALSERAAIEDRDRRTSELMLARSGVVAGDLASQLAKVVQEGTRRAGREVERLRDIAAHDEGLRPLLGEVRSAVASELNEMRARANEVLDLASKLAVGNLPTLADRTAAAMVRFVASSCCENLEIDDAGWKCRHSQLPEEVAVQIGVLVGRMLDRAAIRASGQIHLRLSSLGAGAPFDTEVCASWSETDGDAVDLEEIAAEIDRLGSASLEISCTHQSDVDGECSLSAHCRVLVVEPPL